ncbi:alpha-methylacyl-CoA racemase [Desulfarculales bacterium]
MPGPLHGLKVLDFTSLLPGPAATLYLADLGAEVLRIVWTGRSDLVEITPPFLPGTAISAAGAYLGRGKRRLSLNLKAPAAVGVVKRLLATYDILLEGYRPGVMSSLGLGYEDLRETNPCLIYCSLTGFGQNGPWARKAGHDINYLALSGIMSHSGRRETGPPPLGIQVADIAAGSFNAVIGILAAVIARRDSGQGQHVDVAMFDGLLALNVLATAGFLIDDREPTPEGQMLNGGTVYDYYRTSDGQYLSVGALESKFFQTFCEALGYSGLASQAGSETDAPDDLVQAKAEIGRIIAGQPLSHWLKIFQNIDACVEPVLSLGQALELDQTRARKMIVELEGPEGRRLRQLGSPIKFSATTAASSFVTAPDNTEGQGLLGALGFRKEEIHQLIQTGVLAN